MEITKFENRICEEASRLRTSLVADEAISPWIRSPRDRSRVKQSKTIAREFAIFLALPLRLLVFIYQKTVSPDHGLTRGLFPYGYCKFYPSCSAYADSVLKKHGLIGIPKIINRLIKCRPGQACTVDLP